MALDTEIPANPKNVGRTRVERAVLQAGGHRFDPGWVHREKGLHVVPAGRRRAGRPTASIVILAIDPAKRWPGWISHRHWRRRGLLGRAGVDPLRATMIGLLALGAALGSYVAAQYVRVCGPGRLGQKAAPIAELPPVQREDVPLADILG